MRPFRRPKPLDSSVAALLELTAELERRIAAELEGKIGAREEPLIQVSLQDAPALTAARALEAGDVVRLYGPLSKQGTLTFVATDADMQFLATASSLSQSNLRRLLKPVTELLQTVDADLPPLTPWGDTTNPHRASRSFRYIVHAANPYYRESAALKQTEPDGVNVFIEPGRLVEAGYLNASLVDDRHTGLFGPVGLILDVPSPNVIFAADRDSDRYADMLLAMHARGETSVMSPEDVLSRDSDHNELGLVLDGEYAAVRAIGYFSATKPNGSAVHPRLSQGIGLVAKHFDMPHVFFESTGRRIHAASQRNRFVETDTPVHAEVTRGGSKQLSFVAVKDGEDAMAILNNGTSWRTTWEDLSGLFDVHISLGEQWAQQVWQSTEPVPLAPALEFVKQGLAASDNAAQSIASARMLERLSKGLEQGRPASGIDPSRGL